MQVQIYLCAYRRILCKFMYARVCIVGLYASACIPVCMLIGLYVSAYIPVCNTVYAMGLDRLCITSSCDSFSSEVS